MKLLIITQMVDKNDPVLGFFHRWIIEFAKYFTFITVICLREGAFDLPQNVKVLSLGKETGESRVKYLVNFYKYLWQERHHYDAVFVHMNQEYLLLAGWWWRLYGKKVTLWRNHHAGSWLTDLAAAFCAKVFCTSKFSYTAKYKKTVLMPVGVDTNLFKPAPNVTRRPNSILFLGRVAPVKQPDLLLRALNVLLEREVNFTANFYGDALGKDQAYYETIKNMAPESATFHSGVPNDDTVKIYQQHEIFVNLSSSGMYDKTIFEAMACGCLVLASNENLRGQIDDRFIFKQGDLTELAEKLSKLLFLSGQEKSAAQQPLLAFAEQHSLSKLAQKLATELS